ncbi:carboxymuconolactone decarboxylase family protein [Enterovirga sp. CN4-39]|uniref:carboxymuconolactone decarboxylase family protein n=1 Tax=Enterovirga sp. CN4-39 TaxID=3400910 RepID=UPI003BFF597D
MHERLVYGKVVPDAYKAVLGLETYVQKSGLERRFVHLVKLRASQINGCAYCVDMHSKEARHDGLSEQWINLLCVWQESPVYDARERALLAWTEAVTLLADTGAPDEDYAALREHFSDEDIVKLTVAIATINVWNRLAVGFRSQHPVDKTAPAA